VKYEAEFSEPIISSIPSIIELLEDRNEDVRQKTAGLIDKLANHGEWKLNGIAAQLMWITKPNFVRL
jgi:hypothetical protein